MKKLNRQSAIELLRITAMLGIITLHYNNGRALVYVQDENNIKKYILYFLESMNICAVNLFVLISAYFLCCTQKRRIRKVIELIIQVMVFNEIYYIIQVILGNDELSVRSIAGNLVPSNYYVILYSALYIISPYLNMVFKGWNKKEWNKFIITIVCLFSVYPILVDLSGEILNKEWFGLSTVGAWGNQQGFTITNFVLIYFIGAYIRFNNMKINKRKNFIMILVVIFIILAWSIFNDHTKHFGSRSAWCYHNPFVIALAVLVFLLFYDVCFYSKYINELAKAAFTCYLFHGYVLKELNIDKIVASSWCIMLMHLVFCVIAIYILSYFIYQLYTFCSDAIMRKIEKIINKVRLGKEL